MNMPDVSKAMLELFADGVPRTLDQVMFALHISQRSCRRLLPALVERGHLVTLKYRNGFKYQIAGYIPPVHEEPVKIVIAGRYKPEFKPMGIVDLNEFGKSCVAGRNPMTGLA